MPDRLVLGSQLDQAKALQALRFYHQKSNRMNLREAAQLSARSFQSAQ